MRRRIRLLLLSSSLRTTRLIVCDEERVVLDEEVIHDNLDLTHRTEDVLGALHYKGMNLTRFNAVAVWTPAEADGTGGAPPSFVPPGDHAGECPASAMARLISGQLNIPCIWLGDHPAEAGELVRLAVKIYQKGV